MSSGLIIALGILLLCGALIPCIFSIGHYFEALSKDVAARTQDFKRGKHLVE